MSYVKTGRRSITRYSPRGSRPRPLSDFQDFFRAGTASSEDQIKCLNQANASPAVTQIDAKIADLIATWKPTGVYTPADISKMMAMVATLTSDARDVLLKLPPESYGIVNARNYLDINDARVARYRAAVAASGGKKIPAPDLKSEILKSLVNIQNVYVTADVITCLLTWGQKAAAIINQAVDFLKRFVGAVLELGESAAKAIRAPLDLIGWLGDHAYVPVAIGAFILYKHYYNKT